MVAKMPVNGLRRDTARRFRRAGVLLAKMRKDAGLTQQRLAAALGVPKDHVSWVENGYGRVRPEHFIGWARAVKLTPRDLVTAVFPHYEPHAAAVLGFRA